MNSTTTTRKKTKIQPKEPNNEISEKLEGGIIVRRYNGLKIEVEEEEKRE
jgi:hypothetical protein